ncbi:MAG: hypothetical protein O2905_00800 [Proteobacteria bacterium]|nr:hypothetical protein [Pseudomonadota bacterium]MDA1131749.1 hypothetical protein [Pseudomonadota bacterium]
MIVLWAAILFIVASAAVLGYAAFRYKQILSVTNFFIKAATVYVLIGEEDAQLAALASGKAANGKDRVRMLDFLKSLEDQFGSHKQWKRQSTRIKELSGAIAAPTAHEAVEAREQLRRKNESYLRALRTGDAAIFLRNYPQLFGTDAEAAVASGEHPDEATEEMLAEARSDKGRGPTT